MLPCKCRSIDQQHQGKKSIQNVLIAYGESWEAGAQCLEVQRGRSKIVALVSDGIQQEECAYRDSQHHDSLNHALNAPQPQVFTAQKPICPHQPKSEHDKYSDQIGDDDETIG